MTQDEMLQTYAQYLRPPTPMHPQNQQQGNMGFNSMGFNGMGFSGMGFNNMGCDGMEFNGMDSNMMSHSNNPGFMPSAFGPPMQFDSFGNPVGFGISMQGN